MGGGAERRKDEAGNRSWRDKEEENISRGGRTGIGLYPVWALRRPPSCMTSSIRVATPPARFFRSRNPPRPKAVRPEGTEEDPGEGARQADSRNR